MLLPRAWNHAVLFGCVTWLLRIFVGHVGYCWHGSLCFVLPGKSRLSQGQPFAARVGSMLVAWSSSACATTIQILFLVPFLEYAVVLDDKATLWFLHYIRCYPCVMRQSTTWYALRPPSVGVARDARRRDGLGTNEYLCSALELTELSLSTAT